MGVKSRFKDAQRGRGAFCKWMKVKPGGKLDISEVRMLT